MMATIIDTVKAVRVASMNHINGLRSDIKTIRATRSMGTFDLGNLSLGKVFDQVKARVATAQTNIKSAVSQRTGKSFIPINTGIRQDVRLQPRGPIAQEVRLS